MSLGQQGLNYQYYYKIPHSLLLNLYLPTTEHTNVQHDSYHVNKRRTTQPHRQDVTPGAILSNLVTNSLKNAS